MSNYESVKSYRQRQKENIIYVMGGECACCGYKKCNSALELHHLDPEKKDFTFSDNTNRAWDMVVQELPKTILVCANCHREIHAGLIDITTLQSSFNNEKAIEVSQTTEKSKRGFHFCKVCGKKVSSKAYYCSECYGKTKREVKRPSREQLKLDIRTLPMIQVGKKYGVTDNAVRKWCDSMNLPRKVSDIKTYTDEEWEQI